MRLSIGRWDIELDAHARRGILDYKYFVTETGTHRVWWRFSLKIDDATIETYRVCGECDADELSNVSIGDEWVRVCKSCRSVEGSVRYLNKRDYEKEYL